MDSTIYAFAEDLRGEGVAQVLDRVVDEYGCTGITVAAAYHRARDVTPHGPRRVTWRGDGVHFPVPDDLFAGLRLVPPEQEGTSPLPEARRRTRERGVALHGWTVFLHNTTLGLAHPDVTQENCFGDLAAPADLCPANPDVRAYAVALARAVARLGVDAVVAESLHYGSFGHGYHHERSFVELGPVEEFLLGLCFCTHCGGPRARAEAATAVRRVLDGARPLPVELSQDALAEHVGDAVVDLVRARVETVTSLAAEVAAAVADEGSRFVFLDVMGAHKGYADGLPSGDPAAADAWRIGVEPAAVGAVTHGYAMLGYACDPARIATDVAAYRAAVGPDRELRVVLRPGLPDTSSAEHLGAKVRAARAADAVDFYNYGMAPFPVLARIPEALAWT